MLFKSLYCNEWTVTSDFGEGFEGKQKNSRERFSLFREHFRGLEQNTIRNMDGTGI
jgi:hypothetical protein